MCRLTGLICALIASSAFAQQAAPVPEFRLERFNFNSGARKGYTAASGDLLDKGQLHLLFALHYQHNPLVLYTDTARTGALVGPRLTLHGAVGYGITSWLQASLELPILLFQSGETLAGVKAPDVGGISSPIVNLRLGLLSQGDGALALKDAPLDLALGLGVVVPLATGASLSRDFIVMPQVSLGRDFGLFRLGGEITPWIRGAPLVLSPTASTIRDAVGHQLGAKLIVSKMFTEAFGAELSGHGGFPLGGGATPAAGELLLGLHYLIGPMDVFLLGGPGFGQLPGSPAFRLMAGAQLAPKQDPCKPGKKHTPQECPDLDDDEDGVLNKADQCHGEKEDKDDFQDADGCIDPDDDGDKVLDVNDRCRLVKGVPENKGCPEPDTDKDGTIDRMDKCPHEPGPKDRLGCPVNDQDQDGIEDSQDACPAVAGVPEFKGCPDTDKDGIEDAQDDCPKVPGTKALKGCPDRDGDEVGDAVDNCPDEKGDKDNAGCPKSKKQLVEITREKIIIKDKIFFATAKAVILPKSFPLLDQVAAVLQQHKEIEGIEIQGHTDNKGKREYNIKLSQARAESVKTYLTSKGVDGTRLKAHGYGPDRPADTNATEAGRSNNRRVEFVIESGETIKVKTKEVP